MVGKLVVVVGRDTFENDTEGFLGVSLPSGSFNLNAFSPVQMPILSLIFAGFHLLRVDIFVDEKRFILAGETFFGKGQFDLQSTCIPRQGITTWYFIFQVTSCVRQ